MSPTDRLPLVDRADPRLSIVAQCRLLKIARSTLYYRPAPVSADDLQVMRQLDKQYLATPFYGARRMVAVLRREQDVLGRVVPFTDETELRAHIAEVVGGGEAGQSWTHREGAEQQTDEQAGIDAQRALGDEMDRVARQLEALRDEKAADGEEDVNPQAAAPDQEQNEHDPGEDQGEENEE